MRLTQYYLLGLATNLLVSLASEVGLAFTIIPQQPGASGHYDSSTLYNLSKGVWGETWLDTYLAWYPETGKDVSYGVTEIVRGGTAGFLQLLEPFEEQGWTFNLAPRDLSGSFEILHYYACDPSTYCGIEDFPNDSDRDGVGAHFHLKYRPGNNDPYGDNVHWIQRVISSYTENSENDPDDSLDIDPDQDNPYYDDGGTANTNYFIDTPYALDPRITHYFTAELYLVEENPNRPKEVTIYNGVRWGWKNKLISVQAFSDGLSSGIEVDNFSLSSLTPGAKFYAWINNDLPSNGCNPNTYLSGYNDSGSWFGYDDNSSPVGDGFASALTGTVGSNGSINLAVSAANGGRRGEDRGNYELYVRLYDEGESLPPELSVGDSGGGGVGNESPGRTQQNPILASATEQGWQVFQNVPSCRWYDPPTPYGFEFQGISDTLFTEIVNFPTGSDNLFTVSVEDTFVGEFSPGQSVDFVSLFGRGVSNFKITDIDSSFGPTELTAFPIQLAFNNRVGSFQMRPFSKPAPKSVPEPGSIVGLLALGIWSARSLTKRKSGESESHTCTPCYFPSASF